MRELTYYELSILIKNEIKCMFKYIKSNNNGIDFNYIQARCEDILIYTKENKEKAND